MIRKNIFIVVHINNSNVSTTTFREIMGMTKLSGQFFILVKKLQLFAHFTNFIFLSSSQFFFAIKNILMRACVIFDEFP